MVDFNNVKPSIALLKEVKLFHVFTDGELSQILKMGATATHEAHSNIIIEGELSWGLYLLIDGVVGIYKTNKLTGDHYDVGQLRRGSFFGEMSLVDNNPRSATVTALSPCQLFYISKDSFSEFLDSSKDIKLRFYESCVASIVNRLRELDEDYVVSQYQLWKTIIKTEIA